MNNGKVHASVDILLQPNEGTTEAHYDLQTSCCVLQYFDETAT